MKSQLLEAIKVFVNDESGQGVVEYGAMLGLVAVLIAVAAATGKSSCTNAISSAFQSAINKLNTASSATLRK